MDFEPAEPMEMPQEATNEAELEETDDMEIVTNPLSGEFTCAARCRVIYIVSPSASSRFQISH